MFEVIREAKNEPETVLFDTTSEELAERVAATHQQCFDEWLHWELKAGKNPKRALFSVRARPYQEGERGAREAIIRAAQLLLGLSERGTRR